MFVKEHGIRPTIVSSGHDYQGKLNPKHFKVVVETYCYEIIH